MNRDDVTEGSVRYVSIEIERMGEALGLDTTVQKQSLRIFSSVLDEGTDYPLDALSAACLYGAVRLMRKPVTFRDVTDICRVSDKYLKSTTGNLFTSIGLKLPPQDARIVLEGKLDECGVPEEHHADLEELVEMVKDDPELQNKANTTIVAATIYAGSILYGYDCTQSDVAGAVGTTEVSLRNNYRKVLDIAKTELSPEERRFDSFDEAVDTLTSSLDLPDRIVEQVNARVTLAKADLPKSVSFSGVVLAAIYVTLDSQDGFEELADIERLSEYAAATPDTIRRHVEVVQ